jgi:N-sulfoglucosamine sulfohydrolase
MNAIPVGMTTTRRNFIGTLAGAPAFLSGAQRRPNILFAISDDQSWAHTGMAGDKAVKTPAFDRVARSGVYFRNAVTASPGCAPSRAGILTGRAPWQLEEAGTHASHFPRKFQVYPDMLAGAGYHVGLTGKGAGPANFDGSGWPHNPAGLGYNSKKYAAAAKGISGNDYAANFADFLGKKGQDQPFCFWFGASEPHRVFDQGAGLRAGKRLEDASVPPFLPGTREVRSDILDYYMEIEHFDRHLGRVLDLLEKNGELSNTLVVVTSDNGMAFPGAKATMHEYGIHMPLAVSWQARAKGGRTIDDLVGLAAIAPTFLAAAGLPAPRVMTGRSFLDVVTSNRSGRVDPARTSAISHRERHSHSRFDNLGYPARALRTTTHLYIRNFKPDRWPAGDPEGFHDIDDSPTKSYLMANREKERRSFDLTFGKLPGEELYDIVKDPGCTENLAASSAHTGVKEKLRTELERTLTAQGDPRMTGSGDIWESYPRFSPMRPQLGGFAEQGQYNPKYRK